MAGISASTPAPVLNQILSKDARKAAGIGDTYIDTYNDSQLAKYNNEYNYWLWQQQAEYNSPVNQVARLKEAGLNPNFNSIDGTGNLNTTPTSNANYRSDIRSKEIAQAQLGLNAFNMILDSISQGVSAYQKIQNTPNTTRQYLKMAQENNWYGQKADNLLKDIRNLVGLRDDLGIDIDSIFSLYAPSGQNISYNQNYTSDSFEFLPNTSNSINYRSKELGNDLRALESELKQYDLTNLKPEEKELLQKRITQVGLANGLTEKQINSFNAMLGTKMASALLPILLKMF